MLSPKQALERVRDASDLGEAVKIARETLATAPEELTREEAVAAQAAATTVINCGLVSGKAHVPLNDAKRKLAMHEAFHAEKAKELAT